MTGGAATRAGRPRWPTSPCPGPPSTVHRTGPGETVEADGKKTAFEYTAKYDGKDYPVTGTGLFDSIAIKRIVLSNPNVLKIFQITGFDELFAIYPSLGAAVDGTANGNGHG